MQGHRRAIGALAAAAGLIAAAPAYATPPTTTFEVRRPHFVFPDCGSFPLHLDGVVTRETTTFYDSSGVPVRLQVGWRQDSTFSNPLNGRSVPASGNWRITRYYTDGVLNGTIEQTGRTYIVTVPGRGVIFQQAGRGIQVDGYVVFEKGPHDFEERDFAEVCAYLAG
jgi:hypothetical protein